MTLTKPQTNEGFDWKFYDYTLAIEKEWQASLSKFTDRVLLEIFPEAKQIIPEKIKEREQERTEFSDAIKKKLTLIYKIPDEFSQWFWREWVKVNEGQELLKIDEHIMRLKRLSAVAQQGQGQKSKITEEKIQQALYIPIENIANQYLKLRKSGKKALVGLCPFHPEKHPSFYIYPETNSCWCYGCNQGGNVINFVRLLYGYSFVEAVEYLVGEKNEYKYDKSQRSNFRTKNSRN